MAIPRYQSSTTSAPAANIGVMRPPNFAGAMDAGLQPLTQLAREIGADSEAADAQQQQLIGYAEMKLDENGNPTVEMTAGMTPGQRAYNAGAMAAYDAHFKDSVAQKTIELQEKHKHNPESFKAEFQAYRDGVTSEIRDKRFRGRADIIMAQHQTMTYAAITAKKAERDHALGGKANAAHLERVGNNLVSMASTGGMAANGEMITPAGQLLAEDFRESQQAAIKAGYLTPEQVQLMNDNMAVRQQGAYVGYMTKAVINEMRAKGASANQIYAKAFELMSSHADRLQKDAPERFSTEQMAQLKEHMKAQVSLTLAEVQQKDIAIKAAEEKAAKSELLKLEIELSDRHAANDIPGIASVTDKLRAATQRHGEAGAKFLGALNQGRGFIAAHNAEQARMADAANKEASKKISGIVGEVFSGNVSAETRAILDGASDGDSELNIGDEKGPITLDVNEDMPRTLTEKIAQRLGMGKEQTDKLIASARAGVDLKDIAAVLKLIDRMPQGPGKDTAEDNLRKSLSTRTEAVNSALQKETQKQQESYDKIGKYSAWVSGKRDMPVSDAKAGFEEAVKTDTLPFSIKDPANAPRIVALLDSFDGSTDSIDQLTKNDSVDAARYVRALRDAGPEGIGGKSIAPWRHVARADFWDGVLREFDMLGSSIAEQVAANKNATPEQKQKGLEAENERYKAAIRAGRERQTFAESPKGKEMAMTLDNDAQIAAAADSRGLFGRVLSGLGDYVDKGMTSGLTAWSGVSDLMATVAGKDIDTTQLPPSLIADYKHGYLRARQLNPNGEEGDWRDSAKAFLAKQNWGVTQYGGNGAKIVTKKPIENSSSLLDWELREQIASFATGVLNARGRTGAYDPQILRDIDPTELRRIIVDEGKFQARWVGSGYELYLNYNGTLVPLGDPLKPAVFVPQSQGSVGDAFRKMGVDIQKAASFGEDSRIDIVKSAGEIFGTVTAKAVEFSLRNWALLGNRVGQEKRLTEMAGGEATEAQMAAGRNYWLQRNKP